MGNITSDPLGFAMQNKMAVGMPLAGAVLGGLEPTDLYGNPIKPGQNPNEKYDPYRTLNLNTNTGLKLYAMGGPVSFADGGDSNKEELSLAPRNLPGGGSGAMQGAGMLPLDVSDINAKYGYDPEASSSGAQPWGGSGLWGSYNTWGARSSMPSVPVPQLGLFADNKQIEEARTAYEAHLAAAMSGRGGMGSTPNAPQVARSMSSLMGGQPTTTTRKGMTLGLGSMGSTAPTADTASTAETSLARLNLNKQYADGGNVEMDSPIPPQLSRDGYGLGRLQAMADGGIAGYAKGGYLDGPGDGMSDSIPATIEGKQPARLADGEFVIPADVVSHLGNGSTKAGSQRLYGMLDKVRKARTGTKKQGKQINPAKYMPA